MLSQRWHNPDAEKDEGSLFYAPMLDQFIY